MEPYRHAEARPRYRTAIRSTAQAALGRQLAGGTIVVGSAAREGSPAAVAYPLGDSTIIWCAPALSERLAPLAGRRALDLDDFGRLGQELGGRIGGYGHHRVLTIAASSPRLDRERVAQLDRHEPADVERIAAFIDACSDDELDEAELELDDLDPVIVAVTDDDGTIAAYASARPWSFDPVFDDIAVITHPKRRGVGLGSEVVRALVVGQQATGRLMFYNCDVDNLGSNAVADSVGFERVATVAAVVFD